MTGRKGRSGRKKINTGNQTRITTMSFREGDIVDKFRETHQQLKEAGVSSDTTDTLGILCDFDRSPTEYIIKILKNTYDHLRARQDPLEIALLIDILKPLFRHCDGNKPKYIIMRDLITELIAITNHHDWEHILNAVKKYRSNLVKEDKQDENTNIEEAD